MHAIAIPGWDTQDEFDTFKKALDEGYRTDMVILVYFFNDISYLNQSMSKLLEEEFRSMIPKNFFIKNSYFLDHFYFRMKIRSAFHVRNYSYDVLESYRGEMWERQKNKIIDFKQLCIGRGIDFALIVFPFMQDIGKEDKHIDLHRKFDSFLKDNGIPYLDLLYVYEKNRSEKLVLNSFDSHPSREAHKIAADAIIVFLKEMEAKKGETR